MKKLMTVLATAATALFAASAVADGEFSESAENFESLTAGAAFEYGNGLDGYWLTAATADEMTVSNHEAEVTFPSRPDKWNGAANNNYLQLDVSTPLARGLEAVDGSAFPGVAIGDGIYLDTLVKFTAADEPFSADLDSGDKIAIEYVDQTSDETIDNPIQGFVIRAGQGQTDGQANYFAAAPANFDVNAWHRLTVRSIADVGDGQVGFVIYLDGNVNPLAYSTDVDAGFGTLDPAVAEKFYNTNLHALYPSAVNSGDNKGVISAAAFSGTGGIDDVVITREVPNFIASGEGVVVPFVADAGVTAISVSVVGVQDPIPVVDGAATLPAQTTNFTVNVTVDTAHGYTFGGITVGETDYDTNPASVEGYAGGAITITTIRNNFNLFDSNGDPIQGTFQTLSEALAADDVAKIVLAHNYDVAESEGAGFGAYDISSNITLDLNGNTITGGGDDELFTVDSGVTMIVIDSSAANTGKIDYTGSYAVFYSEGDVVIGAPNGDYGPTIDGYLAAAEDEGDGIWLVKAKIEAATNSDEGKFLWDGYLGDGEDIESEATLVGDYWVVTPKGVIGTYTVTVTPTANATYAAAYKVGGETITPANDVLTVTVGQTIVITATPAANYEYAETPTGWTAGQDGEITIEVSAAGTVAIPAPSEKTLGTYTVTVTPNANATYAAAYKVGGETITPENDVLTVTVGQTIVITATPAEDYEYAEAPTGWTAGQDGEITIEVSEPGTVAIPAPTAKSSGYDNGGGGTFVIAADREAALESNLPAGKTLASAVSEGSSMTYAQAYALGLWSENSATVGELDATISVDADGKVTVSLANAPATGYLVQCKVYEKASLAVEWPAEPTATYAYGSEIPFTPGSATAGFYKVEVVITNALQQ